MCLCTYVCVCVCVCACVFVHVCVCVCGVSHLCEPPQERDKRERVAEASRKKQQKKAELAQK